MRTSILNDSTDSQDSRRTCLNCNSPITMGNAKRAYCNDTCRVAYYRKTQNQAILSQGQKLEEQSATIQKLTDLPVKKKESIQVVNPEWQLAQQAYSGQMKLCIDLNRKLASLQSEIHRRKGGKRGAYYGAAAAIVLVLCVASYLYDKRKEPTGVSFKVMSLSALLVMGVIGYWLGKGMHNQIVAGKKGKDTDWSRIEPRVSELEKEIVTEQRELDKLQKELSGILRYSSETMTTVEEQRVLT